MNDLGTNPKLQIELLLDADRLRRAGHEGEARMVEGHLRRAKELARRRGRFARIRAAFLAQAPYEIDLADPRLSTARK